MFTLVSKALVSSWASYAAKALSLFDLGVLGRPFFIKNNGNRNNCILIILIAGACNMDQLYYFAMFCIGSGCSFAVFSGW